MGAQFWINLAKLTGPKVFVPLINLLTLRSAKKREAERLIRRLQGVPQPVKALLRVYQTEGTHTLVGDPADADIRYLVSQRFAVIGQAMQRSRWDMDHAIVLTDEVWALLCDKEASRQIFRKPRSE